MLYCTVYCNLSCIGNEGEQWQFGGSSKACLPTHAHQEVVHYCTLSLCYLGAETGRQMIITALQQYRDHLVGQLAHQGETPPSTDYHQHHTQLRHRQHCSYLIFVMSMAKHSQVPQPTCYLTFMAVGEPDFIGKQGTDQGTDNESY